MKRLLIFLSVALLFGSAIAATPVFAQTAQEQTQTKASECSSYTQAAEGVIPKIRVSIPIPGVTESVSCTEDGKNKTINLATDLGSYLANFYKFFVGIVGILATVMVLYGGIRWILAAGNASRIAGAKEVIISAIIGVVIAFTSFLLLYLLNPRFVNYENLGRVIANVTVEDLGKVTSLKCSELPALTKAIIDKKGIECSFNQNDPPQCSLPVGAELYANDVACDDLARVTETLEGTNTNTGIVRAIKGDVCVGTKCGSNAHCATEIGRCISGFLWGTVDWVGNAYVDNMKLLGVCRDGTLMEPRSGRDDLSTKPTGKAYAFGGYGDPNNYVNGLSGMIEDCKTSHIDLAGFTMLIEINDDQGSIFNILPTTDDDFAVDKNCKPVSSKSPKDISQDEWKGIATSFATPLFKATDLGETNAAGFITTMKAAGYRCNIQVDRSVFPSR